MDKELQLDEEESASSQQTNTDNDEVLESQSQMIIAAKYLHIKFLNTVVQVYKILQTCDDVLFHKAYSELYVYASGSNVELLFTSDHISKHDTIEEILKKFSFLWSWHNFSVLRTLLKSCNCQDGLTLLDDFESQIDESQPVELFPIPRLSSKMAPLSSSAYTILSIRSECYQNHQVPLQYTREVAMTLVDAFDISHYALQLLAVQLAPLVMYWMIPKSAVSFIDKKMHKHMNVLRNSGFSEIAAYSNISVSPESNWNLQSLGMLSFEQTKVWN